MSSTPPPASIAGAETGVLVSSSQNIVGSIYDSTPAPQPAVLIDIDDPAVSLPDAEERLGATALDFTDTLARSGLDPASPAYRELWDREAAVADAKFRSMYGGHVWMNHHIRSHHAQLDSSRP